MLSGLQLDESAATPLYQQLFDLIVARIQSRAFPPGHRLPPSRALAAELGAHRNTVVRAYAELEAAGYVSSTVGRGTFVSSPPAPVAPPAPRAGGVPWSSLTASHLAPEPLPPYHRRPPPPPPPPPAARPPRARSAPRRAAACPVCASSSRRISPAKACPRPPTT